jgi:hypothetical protein
MNSNNINNNNYRKPSSSQSCSSLSHKRTDSLVSLNLLCLFCSKNNKKTFKISNGIKHKQN